jgi:hypothetical protein
MEEKEDQNLEKRKIRPSEILISAIVVLCFVVVIATFFFSSPEEEYVPDDEYSSLMKVELAGVDIPTVTAVVGPRVVTEIDWQADVEVVFSLPARGDAGNLTSEELRSYADYLIANESFWSLEYNEYAYDFLLAKILDENKVLSVHARNLAGRVPIDYRILEDADMYGLLRHIEEVDDLLAELSLDAGNFLQEAGGFGDSFVELYSQAALDRLAEMRDEGKDVDDLGREFLLLTLFDNRTNR